jgi:hypothetical protein
MALIVRASMIAGKSAGLPLSRLGAEAMKSNDALPKLNWEDLRKDPLAGNALEVLTTKGASFDRLQELLEVAARSQLFPRKLDLFFVDGMTRKQVADFPQTLRAIAGQVERIRENPQFLPESVRDPAIKGLPAALRKYADSVEQKILFGRSFMKKHPRYLDLAPIFRLKLLDYVKRTTGAPQFSDVATLLQATFSIIGIDIDKVDVDAGALRKLYSRRSKQRSRPIVRED